MADTDASSPILRYNLITQGVEYFQGSDFYPIATSPDAGITQLTGDVLAGPGNGSQAATVTQFHPHTAAGTGTVTPNAALGGTVSITVSGDITLNGPANGYDGQKITIRIANDGSHTVTLATTSTNYRFGTDITSYTNSVSTTDYIGVIWNSAASFWDVVSVIQGF